MAGGGELEVPDLGVLLGRLRTLGQLPFVALSLPNGWFELIADRTTLVEKDPLETADERLLVALDGAAEHSAAKNDGAGKKDGTATKISAATNDATKETGGSPHPSLARVLLQQEGARRPASPPLVRGPIETTPASERHIEERFVEQQGGATASSHHRGFVARRPGSAVAAVEAAARAELAAVLARHAPSAEKAVRREPRNTHQRQGFPESIGRGSFDAAGTPPPDSSSPRAARGDVVRQAHEQTTAFPQMGRSPKDAAEHGRVPPSTTPAPFAVPGNEVPPTTLRRESRSLSRSDLTNQAEQTIVSRARSSALFESLGRVAFASRAAGEQRDELTSSARTTRAKGSSSPLEGSVHPFASHGDDTAAPRQGPGAVPSTSNDGRSLPTATERTPRAVSQPAERAERRSVSKSRLSQPGRIRKPANEPLLARSGSGLRQLVAEWEQQHPPVQAVVDSSETSPLEESSFDEPDFPSELRSARSRSPRREEDDGLLEEERVAQALERVLQRESRRHGLRWEEG